MTTFWELWNAAEKGDGAAQQRVNMLVARQAGVLVDRTGFVDSGEVRFLDDASKPFPDYMSDLNAVAGLVLPENCYISITTPVAPRTTYDVRAFMIDEYDVGRGIAIAHSTRLSSAWVAVWLQVMTGEIAG